MASETRDRRRTIGRVAAVVVGVAVVDEQAEPRTGLFQRVRVKGHRVVENEIACRIFGPVPEQFIAQIVDPRFEGLGQQSLGQTLTKARRRRQCRAAQVLGGCDGRQEAQQDGKDQTAGHRVP